MIAPEGKQGPLSGPSESGCRMWAELCPAKGREVLLAAFLGMVSLPQAVTGL